MKAVVLHEHGGVDKLKYQDFQKPIPLRDELLLRVVTCAVNHLDIWVRMGFAGKKLQFPHILGNSFVGEVASKNKKFPVGTKVLVYPGVSCGKCSRCKAGRENLCPKFAIIGGFSNVHGGYAEYAKVPIRNVLKLPSRFSLDEAACLGVSYLTTWNMLRTIGVSKGMTLLVYGAGSGIGSAAVQLAKAKGAKVITTLSDDVRINHAKKLGAVHIINRTMNDIVTEVMTLTGEGVDAVIDHVGAVTWPISVRCLKLGGKMAVCGATSGEIANLEVRAVYNKQLSISGAYLGTKGQFTEMMRFMQAKRIKPVIDSRFRLSEAASAHERMERNEHFGKILLKVQ